MGPLTPVRRCFGQPDKVRVREQVPQHPGHIRRVIAGQPELCPIAHHAREVIERLRLNKAPLVVTRFRPRIGKEQKGPVKRGIGQGRQQQPRVILQDADVVAAAIEECAQQGGDAVAEDLGADNPDPGIGPCLLRQMFAAAETDLQPKLALIRKEGGDIQRLRLRRNDKRARWQLLVDQLLQ